MGLDSLFRELFLRILEAHIEPGSRSDLLSLVDKLVRTAKDIVSKLEIAESGEGRSIGRPEWKIVLALTQYRREGCVSRENKAKAMEAIAFFKKDEPNRKGFKDIQDLVIQALLALNDFSACTRWSRMKVGGHLRSGAKRKLGRTLVRIGRFGEALPILRDLRGNGVIDEIDFRNEILCLASLNRFREAIDLLDTAPESGFIDDAGLILLSRYLPALHFGDQDLFERLYSRFESEPKLEKARCVP